jgi:uncharacterized protein (DUF302 family)
MSDDFIRNESSLSVEDAVAKVEAASKENGFGVLNTLNLQQIMAGKGVEYAEAATVVEICQPGYAKKFLELDARVAPCLPCRIAITSEGGKTIVQTVRPSSMMKIFQNEEVEKAAREIDDIVGKIINAAS